MIPHVVHVLCTNEKGWRRHQTPIFSCSGVTIPLVKLPELVKSPILSCSGIAIPLVK